MRRGTGWPAPWARGQGPRMCLPIQSTLEGSGRVRGRDSGTARSSASVRNGVTLSLAQMRRRSEERRSGRVLGFMDWPLVLGSAIGPCPRSRNFQRRVRQNRARSTTAWRLATRPHGSHTHGTGDSLRMWFARNEWSRSGGNNDGGNAGTHGGASKKVFLLNEKAKIQMKGRQLADGGVGRMLGFQVVLRPGLQAGDRLSLVRHHRQGPLLMRTTIGGRP